MSDDGADLGILPDRALTAALGGEQPRDEEALSPEQMLELIESATTINDFYSDASLKAATIILEYLRLHPEDEELHASGQWHFPAGINPSTPIDEQYAVQTRQGLYNAMKEKEPILRERLRDLGLSGFMFGWAVNAVHYALDLPPVPNPAIVEIEVPE